MKTLLKVFLIVFFITNLSYSQDAWVVQNSTTEENLLDVYFIDENRGWVVGTNGTILNTVNGGETWTQQISGTSNELRAVKFVNDTTGWVVGYETILYTKDSGQNWYKCEQDYINDITSLFFVDQNHGWICGHGDRILRTNNGLCEWECYWQMMAVEDREWNGVFFLDDKIGWFFYSDGIYKTLDGGCTFVAKHQNVSGRMVNITSLFFLNEDIGWFSKSTRSQNGQMGGSISYTLNGGKTWKSLLVGGPMMAVNFFDDKKGIAVGMGEGRRDATPMIFLRTINGGYNWEADTTEYYRIRDLFFLDINTGWIVGLNGLILKTTIGGISSIPKDENIIIKDFRLSQNHPNPFNPSTTIEYDLPKASDVRIVVYNTAGQRIKTLLNKKMTAGSHQVEFNAENLSSGIYFYRIETGKFQDVKKMILLR